MLHGIPNCALTSKDLTPVKALFAVESPGLTAELAGTEAGGRWLAA